MALNRVETEPDGELVQRTLSGESQAFGRLIEKYQGLIYGLAYNKVGNTADAQDIAQDVFVRAFQKLKQLDDPACFPAWIKTITANECKTWLRNLRPTVSLDESEYSPAHDSAAQSIWRYDEFRAEVAQAIQALSEMNREVITLYYLSGMRCEEIAESLETTPSAVQSRLHRARQLLKAEFTGEIEQVLGGRGLPDGFSREVLRRASVHPTDQGGVYGVWEEDTGVGAVALGLYLDPGTANKMVLVSMRACDASGIILPPPGEPLSDTHPERAKARLAEYRADGMEPIEFILYLDEHDNCKAQGVFRKGRAKVREEMKASLAIALSRHAPAPILVEERIAELREVGEDGLRFRLKSDLDTFMSYPRFGVHFASIDDTMFRLGLEVERGIDTALIRRDMEQRVVHVSIEGLDGVTFDHEFGNDPAWVDRLWEMAERGERGWDLQPDYRRYWMYYSLEGDDVRVTAVLTDDFGMSQK